MSRSRHFSRQILARIPVSRHFSVPGVRIAGPAIADIGVDLDLRRPLDTSESAWPWRGIGGSVDRRFGGSAHILCTGSRSSVSSADAAFGASLHRHRPFLCRPVGATVARCWRARGACLARGWRGPCICLHCSRPRCGRLLGDEIAHWTARTCSFHCLPADTLVGAHVTRRWREIGGSVNRLIGVSAQEIIGRVGAMLCCPAAHAWHASGADLARAWRGCVSPAGASAARASGAPTHRPLTYSMIPHSPLVLATRRAAPLAR